MISLLIFYHGVSGLFRFTERRHIDNSMLDYPAFLAHLNASSSSVSVCSHMSQASHWSQVATDHTANFESSSDYVKQQRQVRAWIAGNIELIMKHYPPAAQYAPTSVKGKTVEDYSIYTGCGGNAYLYWKLSRFFEAEGEQEKAKFHRKNAISTVEVALSMLQPNIRRGSDISFYMGSAGMCRYTNTLINILE